MVLKSIAKHNANLASAIVNAGALVPLVTCLDESDFCVKEAAAWALNNVAAHSVTLASAVLSANSLLLLISGSSDTEPLVRRACLSALSEIAKHNRALAHTSADAGAFTSAVSALSVEDAKVRKAALTVISALVRHGPELATSAIGIANTIPRLLATLADEDESVRRNSAIAIREIVKHTPALAHAFVTSGGAIALVDYLKSCIGSTPGARLPAVMALGYVSSFSETLVGIVLSTNAAATLRDALLLEPEIHARAAAAWALGQLGRHTAEHVSVLAENGVIAALVSTLSSTLAPSNVAGISTGSNVITVSFKKDSLSSSTSGAHSLPSPNATETPPPISDIEDLRSKCLAALKVIVSKCTSTSALSILLRDNDTTLQKMALAQFAFFLPNDPLARKTFMATGLLQRIQELKLNADPKTSEAIFKINHAFPDEAVKFSDPAYAKQLLERLELPST
jgi:Armadillo/beta-catenin-like repeat/HEAT repeat